MTGKRVAVIGAGASGITAIKSAVEEGMFNTRCHISISHCLDLLYTSLPWDLGPPDHSQKFLALSFGLVSREGGIQADRQTDRQSQTDREEIDRQSIKQT